MSTEVLSSPTFWLAILVCYIITFGMRFMERTYGWAFKPHDSFILSEKVRQRRCGAVGGWWWWWWSGAPVDSRRPAGLLAAAAAACLCRHSHMAGRAWAAAG